jgi:hypothetical protein
MHVGNYRTKDAWSKDYEHDTDPCAQRNPSAAVRRPVQIFDTCWKVGGFAKQQVKRSMIGFPFCFCTLFLLTSTATAVFQSSLLTLTAVFQSSKKQTCQTSRVPVLNRILCHNTTYEAGFLHRLHWGSACADGTRVSVIANSPGWTASCSRTIF